MPTNRQSKRPISASVAERLEVLYRHFNRRDFVSPDPLEVVYDYSDPRDQEVAGLISASLAFGNVKQIVRSARGVLHELGAPASGVANATPASLRSRFRRFRHRYVGCDELVDLLRGIAVTLETFGSLETCFRSGLSPDDGLQSGLSALVDHLSSSGRGKNYLLPQPKRGSACKRLHMYLRWMIREDEIDPGTWADVSPEVLIIPVDTHMHRVARALGLTKRNAADLRTAVEITEAFRSIAPNDPVRYDFALTRLGIRDDTVCAKYLFQGGPVPIHEHGAPHGTIPEVNPLTVGPTP